jgi:hypothetical protein
MKRKIISFLFAIFCVVNISAQDFTFENLGNPISKKDSAKIIRMIAYEVDFFNKISPLDSVYVKLVVVDDKEISKLKYAKRLNDVRGFYNDKLKTSFVRRKKGEDFLLIVYHENVHYLLHLLMKKPPVWLGEGLSDYFYHATASKKKIVHDMDEYEKGRIKTMIEIKDIDLKDFLTLKRPEFQKKHRTNENYAYVLSHSIVYFLIEKDFNQFKQMVLKIKDGSSSYDAVDSTYSGGFAQFETDFIAYFSK